jgi:hypothetical protein
MLYDGRKLDRSGVGAGRGEPRDRARVGAGLPEHDGVPLDVDAAAAGPAGELRVLPRRDVGVRLAVPLGQLLEHDRPGRHVDAERERLGREHRLDQAVGEQLLDHLLEGRQHPGVVGGEAPLQAVEPLPVAEHPQVLARQRARAPLDVHADALGLLRGVEPQARAHALLDRRGAARPAEDEGDGRQQPLAVEPRQTRPAG